MQQKLDVIDLFDTSSGDYEMIMKQTNVSMRLIKEWIKNRAKIENSKGRLVKRRLSGGGRKPLSLELDNMVIKLNILLMNLILIY